MFEIKFDLKQLVLTQLMSLNKNKDNIEKNQDKLYKIVQNYLKILNANPKFLDKPSIIERVKHIIFNNLLLSENVQFKNNGLVSSDSEKGITKIFSVLNNGSIIFYQEKNGEKLVVSFDELDEGLACRFLEYSRGDFLKSEKRVILDEYGFDKRFYEIEDALAIEDMNEKLREKFKHIITHINGKSVIAFTDWGNHSITPLLDNKFLCAEGARKIAPEELYEENRYQAIKMEDEENWLAAFPFDIPEMDDYSASKVQAAYNYYTNKYPLARAWFINRYGKSFLKDKNIISKNDEFEEDSFIDKLSQATQEEVAINFRKGTKVDIDEKTILYIIENMYSKKMYGKAIVFFDKLTDKQKIEFLKNCDGYEYNFISQCIVCIEDESKKIEQYNEFFDQLSLNNKIAIISSLKDEDDKVELYEDILDEIIEYDTEQEDAIQGEEDVCVEILYLSEAVLDSLNDKGNIKEFILKFSNFPIIKYEHIKDMTKEDIDYLLENLEGNLDTEENIAFLKTDYVDDEYILYLLKSNWEEGLELSSDAPIELGDDLSYSFKVYALSKIKDEGKRLKFLDEYKKDFSAEEIVILLEDIEDPVLMLNLAKKYNLPEDYVYGLVTLCEDDFKIMFLTYQENIESENFIRVASSIQDIKKAFDFVTQTDKADIITKLETINEFYVELAEDEEDVSELSERKFEFLIQNTKKILSAIKTKEDSETLNLYISEFWSDDEKMAKIEKPFKDVIEQESK